jgi:hypothetical protein
MSIYINQNNGPIYEGCNVTINNGKVETVSPKNERASSSAEDVQDVQSAPIACSQKEQAKEQAQPRFALLTAQCIQEGKAEAVEAELRSAANGSAAKLVAAIRTNEALGYLDTKNMSSQALYDALNAYFGLKYSVRNFTKYRR